jgi:hypothetical protein
MNLMQNSFCHEDAMWDEIAWHGITLLVCRQYSATSYFFVERYQGNSVSPA